MATRYGSYTYGTQHDRSLLAPKAVQQPWYRIWLIAGSIAVFTLTLVSLNTGWPFFSSSSERNYISSTNVSPYRDMMIAMHPNEHKWRGSQTREHTWNITSDFLRPDGVRREIILINDNFPGPTIEARPGDTIVVHVQNFFRESVSVHWHGLQMRGMCLCSVHYSILSDDAAQGRITWTDQLESHSALFHLVAISPTVSTSAKTKLELFGK